MTLSHYKSFIKERRSAVLKCDSCQSTPEELGEPLHAHHLMPVCEMIRMDDPCLVDEGNIIMVCSCCHALFHPSKRDYTSLAWESAGRKRGGSF